MEYKSNITIASNIYVRRNHDLTRDPDFVHNCRGGIALRDLQNRLFGTSVSVKLTTVQDKERQEDLRCINAHDKQITHGAVKNGDSIVWECRCEYEECTGCKNRFGQIEYVPKRYPRLSDDNLDFSKDNQNNQELRYEWLGDIEQIFDVPIESDQDIEDESIPDEFAETAVTIAGEYVRIEEPSVIIEADISSHILVNAGPGTGKTHTVIERLAHIIESGAVDLGQALVLCYTNAARDVILERLSDKGLAAEARQLVICTLDSLAWNNLSQKMDDDLFALGFNGCIQLFNAKFDTEEWSDFEYVIIDELQDLVNERAKMTLNILQSLRCGYLLLGDKCQAIYDYDCDGMERINSVSFYKSLYDLLPDNAAKYELVGNRRQSLDLSRRSDDFRYALLEFGIPEANEFFNSEIKALRSKTFSPSDFAILPPDKTTAILTRNNGEAEWVSAQLHKKDIPHTLLRSVTPHVSLQRWLADMFWDYRENRIDKDDFVERYLVRVVDDVQAAESAFKAILTSLSEGNSGEGETDFFDLRELKKVLKRGQDISPLLINPPCNTLTVSTIHKAKGREFDSVYLFSGFKPSLSNTEEARVWYVGATRPKSILEPIEPIKLYVSKPTPMNRRMLTGRKSFCTFCQRLVVGLTEDIDPIGFIDGNLKDAINVQKYIANQIEINDTIELIREGDIYNIVHNGNVIGRLNKEVASDFWAAIRKTGNRSNIPSHLTEIYVNNIMTIVPQCFPSGVDTMFKESNLWLGVELTGFAKVDWHWGGN